MQYDFHENSHSNILAYFFNYDTFFLGAPILIDLIKFCPVEYSGLLSEKILLKSYLVEREFSVSSGRIELLIIDKKEKFVI